MVSDIVTLAQCPSHLCCRKKKKKKILDKDAIEAEWKSVSKQSSEGQEVVKKTKTEYHKTEAEKKYDKVQKERVSGFEKQLSCVRR